MTAAITTNGVACAIAAGLITLDSDGRIEWHDELLPTESSRTAEQARHEWEASGARTEGMAPPLTACVYAAVEAGVTCPQDVSDWLGVDVTDTVTDTFIRFKIDNLIRQGRGNAAIRDLSNRWGWPVSTARVATRRHRINNPN